MEWYWILICIFGSLIGLMITGLPIAFCFLTISTIGAFIFFGGTGGLITLIDSIFSSLNVFTLVAVPMYVLMGEIMFFSGIGNRLVHVVDIWLGRMPGRLGVLSVCTATVFSTVSGSTMATTAMLGSVLVPEMEKRGYKKAMSLGPIVGAGGLAMMIPPSALGVLLASIAKVSVAKLLIGGILPGIMMAIFYTGYIISRSLLQPSVAPLYKVPSISLPEKVKYLLRDLLPISFLIFLVIGLLVMGVATPSESAAVGVIGAILLALAYRELKWPTMKKSLSATSDVTTMVFMIVAASLIFSQILSFSGASTGLIRLATQTVTIPILLIILMEIVVLLLGCFMESLALMMITVPIFMPIVQIIGWDPIWFCILLLINIETGLITPPFGINLFVMKSVVPKDVTMGQVITSTTPFMMINLLVMALLIAFPAIALWLPAFTK